MNNLQNNNKLEAVSFKILRYARRQNFSHFFRKRAVFELFFISGSCWSSLEYHCFTWKSHLFRSRIGITLPAAFGLASWVATIEPPYSSICDGDESNRALFTYVTNSFFPGRLSSQTFLVPSDKSEKFDALPADLFFYNFRASISGDGWTSGSLETLIGKIWGSESVEGIGRAILRQQYICASSAVPV